MVPCHQLAQPCRCPVAPTIQLQCISSSLLSPQLATQHAAMQRAAAIQSAQQRHSGQLVHASSWVHASKRDLCRSQRILQTCCASQQQSSEPAVQPDQSDAAVTSQPGSKGSSNSDRRSRLLRNSRAKRPTGRFSKQSRRAVQHEPEPHEDTLADLPAAASPSGPLWYEAPAATDITAHPSRDAVDLASSLAAAFSAQNGQSSSDSYKNTAGRQADAAAASSSSSGTSSSLSQHLSQLQMSQLRQYLETMLTVNKSMNLTAVRDPEGAWQRHIEDSLALLPVIDKYTAAISMRKQAAAAGSKHKGKQRHEQQQQAAATDSSSVVDAVLADPVTRQLAVIDVGTGAGLPGMVLAIARPHWQVTLLDSLRKRCEFLTGTAQLLGLHNVCVVWCRAEEGGVRPGLRETHDLAVARAVAELRVLSELCLPFVRPGGMLVAAKGPTPQEEVAAANASVNKLGGKLCAVELVNSWAPEGQRTAVVVAKTSSTPGKYPRPPGTPAKSPL